MIRMRSAVTVAVLSTALAVAAGACGKKKPQVVVAPPTPAPAPTVTPTPPAPQRGTPPPAPPTPAPAPAPLTEEQIFARKTLDQLNQEKPLDDVFFDLDAATLRQEALPQLQKNADWMKKWSGTQVIVEGHADSRGSSEYNLALGARRAEAVKQYVVSLGVAATRLTVVSKGKEQPFCNEETEACWQQNRRGHFIVSAK
jgi:peptidoglycan-associated lipoprotein